MNKEFTRVRTKTDIAVSSALIVSGIVFIALPESSSLNITGFFALAAGAFLLAILKTGWQDSETKEHYCKKDMYFPLNDKVRIMNALEGGIESIDMSGEGKGEGLKMEVYYNKRKAFVSLLEYIPYKYEPASPTYEYTTDRIKRLIG